MGLRAPKGPKQPMIGNESLDGYFPKPTNEEQQLRAMIEKQMVEGIDKQRENEELQRLMLEKSLSQGVQPDLSAAWGLVKAAGGDTSAANLAPKDLNPDVLALQKELQKTSAGITDDEINLLRAKLQNKKEDKDRKTQERFMFAKELDIRSRINNSDEAKKIKANTTLADRINKYEQVLQEVGNKTSLTGKDKAKIDAAAAAAQIAWKEAANLGALVGGDFKMIEEAVSQTPTTIGGFGKYVVAGGVEGIKEKLKTAREESGRMGKFNLQNLQTVYPYEVGQSIYENYDKELSKAAGVSRGTEDTGILGAPSAQAAPMSEEQFIQKFLEAKKKK